MKTVKLINDYYVEQVKNGYHLTPDDIHTLLIANEERLQQRRRWLHAYKKKGLKVQKRHSTTLQQATNKIPNHFRKLIVDQKTDYLTGTPITFNYEEDITINGHVQTILKQNHYDYLDAENTRLMSAGGVSYRLAYLNEAGDLCFKILRSDEVISLDDDHRVFVAIHQQVKLDKNGERYLHLTVYDQDCIRIYHHDVNGLHLVDEQDHYFNHCPVIAFYNKDSEPDYLCVDELIDAYDEIVSLSADEIAEFRLAYLTILSDVELEDDALVQAKKSGAIYVNDPNAKIQYVTKNLNDAFFESAKATIEGNIYKFSSTLDMSEESFTGASGEARKWKLLALENKAQASERLLIKAFRHQFELIADYLALKYSVNFDPLQLQIVFNRNLPSEISQIVEENNKLQGQVSQRTLLSRLPFIQDVEKELQQLEAESGDIYLKAFQSIQRPLEDEEGNLDG